MKNCGSKIVWSGGGRRAEWVRMAVMGSSVGLAIVGSTLYYTAQRSPSTREERYQVCQLDSVNRLSSHHSIFNLRCPQFNLPTYDHPFYIHSLYIKHPGLQIQRAYTPISDDAIQLMIKRYPDGYMSSYLHYEIDHHSSKQKIEVYGPILSWMYQRPSETIDEIVFIAAGTGVTPAVQLLHRIYKNTRNQERVPKFKLIYLNSSIDSTHLLAHIDNIRSRYPDLIESKLVIEQKEPGAKVDKWGRLESDDLKRWIGPPKDQHNQIVLVCGPDEFINLVAGPKAPDMVSQGKIGGILKNLGFTSQQVYKL